jgi:PAS domain S-box-containing protein
MPHPPSLRKQLIWPLLGLGLIIVILSAWLASHLITKEVRALALQRIQDLALTVQSGIEAGPETLQNLVSAIGADADIEFIVVAGGLPATVLAATRLEWTHLSVSYIEDAHVREKLEYVLRTRLNDEHGHPDSFGVTLPLHLIDPDSGALQWGALAVHLHVGAAYRRALAKGMQISLWLLVVVGGYLTLAYLLLRRAMLKPLENICAAITDSGLNAPLPLPHKASEELSVLVNTLNQVLASLAHSQAGARRLALIVRHTHQGVLLTDSAGRIEWANEACLTLCGYALDDIQGKPLSFIFTHEQADSDALTALQWALHNGGRFDGELRARRQDSQYFWLTLQVQAVRDPQNDALRYFFAIITDIDGRKHMEADLEAERALLAERVAERTAELMEANRELAKLSHLRSDFIASMSHELRTPLNAILGFSGSLLEQTYGNLNERQARSVRNIEKSGRHLLGIINDILDLSKIEAGKFVLRPALLSVHEVCSASLEFVRPQAEKQKIHLRLDIDRQCKNLYADERRLRQILVNLLSNAVKFTPAGRWVGLRVSLAEENAAQTVFCVWDEGAGISAADQAVLFQPFMQVDSSLTRRHEGTGLGLVLVRRFTELHGGRVWLESEEGQGSRFYVLLPSHETQAA